MQRAARQTQSHPPQAEVQRAFEQLTRARRANPNPSLAEREDWLERLEQLIVRFREDFVAAAHADFGGRARHETLTADVLLTLDSARDARRNVARWLRERPVHPHQAFKGSRAWVEYLPRGVVAILSPWNYPVNLALAPLAGALAAGNRALLKPSELTPRVSAALARAVRETFSAEEVAVVEGGPEVARAVTRLPLDHLFFTGSTRVGREVAKAAAENLVPVTLELGGKSPVLVHPDYPVATAAERVAVGKRFNGGQTCIAPDYVLVPEDKVGVFAEAFTATLARGWPQLPSDDSYTAQVTDAALARQQALLDDAEKKGARLVRTGGAPDGRKLAPVLVLDAHDEMRVMQEEIFGPLLPVLGYRTFDDALAQVEKHPNPLALYLFDEDEARARKVLARLPSGGACLNDTLAHFAQEGLPFGGTGHSGTGAYHGRAGFLTFSHARGVFASNPLSPGRLAYGPSAPALIERATSAVTSRLGAWVMGRLQPKND